MELAVQTAGPYEDVVDVAAWAEEIGLAAIALPDHYLYGPVDDTPGRPAPDALAQLAGLARDTERLELVSLVSPITFRHPAVHAKMAVTIDRMSGGRLTMGLGTGWMDSEHEVFGIPYPPMSERFELLEEQLAYLRAVRDNTSFEGDHYTLGDFDIQPRPEGKLKILVGGAGPKKTPRLAGTYADEFNAYARPLDVFEDRIATARGFATDAGRSIDDLFISTACVAVVGATQAEYDAAKESVAGLFQTPVDELEEKMAEAGNLHGTPNQVAETLAAWSDIGVQRYYVQRPGETVEQRQALFDLLGAAM